ncbi:DAK2 domain-containing protein, partial [Angustibacter aerolatus]
MLDRLDAPAVRRWATTALSRLGAERAALDALNVYPVPDGDTGTNLHLTVQDAVAGLGSRPAEGDDAAGVADAMARGALRGARGSSGVILSQLLRGWADALLADPEGGAAAVRDALT